MLLVDFVTFLGFKVNSAKCEGPAQVLEFLGVLLDTSGEVCTASIDEERIVVVVQKAGALRAQAARGMVLDDLAVLEQVVRQYNGSRVVLERRLVDPRHFATGTLGFGGVWERLFFMLNWEDLAWLPQRPCFPRRKDCRSSWSITYLELFAIFFVCTRHDIRLQPVYINTKDNLLADLLSRLDMPRFLAEHKAFLRADIWRQDRDDWMVCPWGTAACFLVHVWDGVDGWELVKSLPHVFRVVREWKKGTHLFTAPDLRGHGKTAWGPTSYAGHSLRRGGATAAMRLDVASIYIKTGLDWKSDCFERYCELATEQKLILTGVMAEAAAAADR
ncbi:hypothetical protein CYMTET_38156 [Cymbomonas tetramitiformis]|uniref:Uncharacterized protein n=1 Tax=Cymbomonas tetramitiformis TaxID=36881 RepID=A0AAE0CDU8_9CHLO|nr:hypothetical protein CYMTET_38156 [Cymbomonas tetramitiformis]